MKYPNYLLVMDLFYALRALGGQKATLRDLLKLAKRIKRNDAGTLTYCKDCGVVTKQGPGSARCKECWEDRCGQ